MPLFQNESKCETIHMKMSLICMTMNGFALRLVLKHRQEGTRKWPIKLITNTSVQSLVKRGKWLGRPVDFKEANKQDNIYVGRSLTLHIFCFMHNV